jgi:site-specific recombinase XerD
LSLRQIQLLLGHANNIGTTIRYTHMTDVLEKDTLTVINDMVNTLRIDFGTVSP